MNDRTKAQRRIRTAGTGLLAGLASLALLGTAGCGGKGAGSSIAPAATPAANVVAEPAPPTLAELQTALNLTAEQAANLATPLRNWEQAQAELATRIGNGEGDGFGPEYGLGSAIEPPHFRFLEEASPLLTREQLRRLARFLEERREAERLRLEREGRLPGPGTVWVRIARTLHDEFSLTRLQMQALHDAFRAAHEAMRTLHADYAAGTITAEVARDGVAAALQTLTGDLQTALGADAYARLTDLLSQARAAIAQRLLDTLGARTDRHFAFLTLVLGLDEAQQTAVRAALDDAKASTEALLIEVRDGAVTFPDALYRHLQIHETLRAAVHAALTQEQIDLLGALRPLMRHDPPLPLYF